MIFRSGAFAVNCESHCQPFSVHCQNQGEHTLIALEIKLMSCNSVSGNLFAKGNVITLTTCVIRRESINTVSIPRASQPCCSWISLEIPLLLWMERVSALEQMPSEKDSAHFISGSNICSASRMTDNGWQGTGVTPSRPLSDEVQGDRGVRLRERTICCFTVDSPSLLTDNMSSTSRFI